MARFTGTATSPHRAEDVWRYLADLRLIAEWDESVKSARLVSGEPGTAGARYELAVGFGGRTITLDYLTEIAEPPTRVVFTAETGGVTVRDEARVTPLPDGGTSVVWDATLALSGLRRLLDPLVGALFNRLGASAERGLRARLSEPGPFRASPAEPGAPATAPQGRG